MMLGNDITIIVIVIVATVHHHGIVTSAVKTDGSRVHGFRRERSASPVTAPVEFIRAIKQGNLKSVRELIAGGADVDYGSDDSSSKPTRGYPLSLAAENNRSDIVDLLLDAGADVNADEVYGGVIIGAAEKGHVGIVKKLLEAGFDPDTEGGFALVQAIEHGHRQVLDAYIDANVNLTAKDGWILSSAGWSGDSAIVWKILNTGGISNESYGIILSAASAEGHVGIVKIMINKGADPTLGLRPAAERGQTKVVRTLLEAGAEITYSTPENPRESPLHAAMIGGHIDVIDVLVEHGADINAPYAADEWWDIYGDMGYHGIGWTVMHLAARWGFQLHLQRLVDLGAEVNAADDKGYRPLHVAVVNLKLEVIKELLKLCGKWTLPDKRGETPLDLAKKTVVRDFSSLPQPSDLLKELASKVLKEKVIYYPYTEGYMKELARFLQNYIQANKTVVKSLEASSSRADWSYLQVATRRVFEEKAVAGLLDAFEGYGCKLTMGGNFQATIGEKYIVHCECLPKKARKLTIKHVPRGKECVGV